MRSTPAGSPGTSGSGGRINVVLQNCFFAISDVLPRDEAITRIKETVAKTYAEHGTEVVQRELAAVDYAIDRLHQIEIPDQVTATYEPGPPVPATAREFVRTVTAEMIAGNGAASDRVRECLRRPGGNGRRRAT